MRSVLLSPFESVTQFSTVWKIRTLVSKCYLPLCRRGLGNGLFSRPRHIRAGARLKCVWVCLTKDVCQFTGSLCRTQAASLETDYTSIYHFEQVEVPLSLVGRFYIHIHMYLSIHVCMFVSMYVYIHTCERVEHTHVHLSLVITHMSTLTHAHPHTHTHARTHTHTHTHTQKHVGIHEWRAGGGCVEGRKRCKLPRSLSLCKLPR
jgi:hypothetical protein